MNADSFASLTECVLSAIFEVSNTLGSGFLEKVYERALLRELALRALRQRGRRHWLSLTKGSVSASTLPIFWRKTS